MKDLSIRLAAMAMLPLALAGCSVMRSIGLAPQKREAPVVFVQNDILTEIGRSQLDQGNPGLAIASFRKALETGEQRAPALNGLGVAYARVGRYDLAEINFRSAAEADPQNERYAANLAKLLQTSGTERLSALQRKQVDTTMTQGGSGAGAAAALAAAEKPTERAVDSGRLVRLSPREFEIRIVAPAPPPATNVARRRTDRAIVRLDLSKIHDTTKTKGAAPE